MKDWWRGLSFEEKMAMTVVISFASGLIALLWIAVAAALVGLLS